MAAAAGGRSIGGGEWRHVQLSSCCRGPERQRPRAGAAGRGGGLPPRVDEDQRLFSLYDCFLL